MRYKTKTPPILSYDHRDAASNYIAYSPRPSANVISTAVEPTEFVIVNVYFWNETSLTLARLRPATHSPWSSCNGNAHNAVIYSPV